MKNFFKKIFSNLFDILGHVFFVGIFFWGLIGSLYMTSTLIYDFFTPDKTTSSVYSSSSNTGYSILDDTDLDTDEDDNYVYVTRTGKCYHRTNCGNGYFYKATLEEAEKRNLVPCSKCY